MLQYILGIIAFLSLMACYALKWVGIGLGGYIAYWAVGSVLGASWPYLIPGYHLIGLAALWLLAYVVALVVLFVSAALTVTG